MTTKFYNTHIDGKHNELRDWSAEKLANHPSGAALYQGRYWFYLGDNQMYYSPDGVNVRPFAPVSSQVLTAPKVIIDTKQQPVDLQHESEALGITVAAIAMNRVRVHCDAFPEEVYLLAGIYRPRLELLWYSMQTQRHWYTRGGTKARSGWKHPDDAVEGPGFNDGWKGGGSPFYNNGATAARRRSEWKIVSRADLVDVTQACVGRLTYTNHAYMRDATGIIVNIKGVVPVDGRFKNRLCGYRKAWGGNLRDVRVAFRVSILDPNAAKLTRIYGPPSEQIRVGTQEHPCIPDVPFFNGSVHLPTARTNPAWTYEKLSMSFGERLP